MSVWNLAHSMSVWKERVTHRKLCMFCSRRTNAQTVCFLAACLHRLLVSFVHLVDSPVLFSVWIFRLFGSFVGSFVRPFAHSFFFICTPFARLLCLQSSFWQLSPLNCLRLANPTTAARRRRTLNIRLVSVHPSNMATITTQVRQRAFWKMCNFRFFNAEKKGRKIDWRPAGRSEAVSELL